MRKCTAYSTNNKYRHKICRLNIHADGGLSTMPQRCGTVRARESRFIVKLSSGANGAGIGAACVEHFLIKARKKRVQAKV